MRRDANGGELRSVFACHEQASALRDAPSAPTPTHAVCKPSRQIAQMKHQNTARNPARPNTVPDLWCARSRSLSALRVTPTLLVLTIPGQT